MSLWWLYLGLAFAGTIDGYLVSPLGSPVPDTLVLAYDHRLSSMTVYTEADGYFSFEVEDGRFYWLHVVPVEESGLAEELGVGEWDLCAARKYRSGSELTWELQWTSTVRGQLSDSAGAALAGVEVTASSLLPSDLGPSVGLTDGTGTFQIEGLHSGAGGVRLSFSGETVPTQYLGPTYDESTSEIVPLTPDSQTDVGARALLAGITVSGWVTGPDGPITGADVRVYSPGQIRSTTTIDGWYETYGLPPGEALAWASVTGHATTYYPDADRPDERVEVFEGDRFDEMNLELPIEARFEGVIQSDLALEGASLLLYNDARTVGFGAQVEADGGFAIGGLHGGDYTLEVFGARVGLTDDLVRDGDGEPRVFSVSKGQVLTVTESVQAGSKVQVSVMDLYTRKPVVGAQIVARNSITGRVRAVVVDDAGEALLEGLGQGEWLLSATYTPYCSGDVNWLPIYYKEAKTEDTQKLLDIGDEKLYEWSPLMPPDDDNDGMDDVWEAEHGLNPAIDDANEDPDGDGLSNLEEYRADSDPQNNPVRSSCGCNGDGTQSSIFLLPILWMGRRAKVSKEFS